MPLNTIRIIIRNKSGVVVSEHVLKEGEHLIGRDKSSDVFIDDEYVSRKHAKLFISNDAIEIEDLESTSGTSLEMDDVTVSDRTHIRPGQRIRISDLYLDITNNKTEITPLGKSAAITSKIFKQGGMIAALFLLLGGILWVVTLPEVPNVPRTRDEIFREKTMLPALYLTEKTKRRVIRPEGSDYFVDKDSGEICWRALECKNPNCPAKELNGSPHLFISPDPTVILNPDGTLGYDLGKAKNQRAQSEGCPECLKIRDLVSETPQTSNQYAGYIRYHILPKTAKRLDELDEEYKQRVEWDNKKN